MVADIGAARGYRASASSCRITRLAGGSRRRTWRARWRWPSGIAIGANHPIAYQADAFDGYGVAHVVNISPNAYPGTIGNWCAFIEGGWELTSSVSDKEPNKEIPRRYHRRWNGNGYKCVRARPRDYSVSLRQYHRVGG